MISKIKLFVKKNKQDVLLFFAIVLVSMFSFSLGYITSKIEEKEPLKFTDPVYEDISNNKDLILSSFLPSYAQR